MISLPHLMNDNAMNQQQSIPEKSIQLRPVIRVNADQHKDAEDAIAVEAPLEIRLHYVRHNKRVFRPLLTTMRTPGNDRELAIGFLVAEGIVRQPSDIRIVNVCQRGDLVRVYLNEHATLKIDARRRFLSNSSCGVCGTSAREFLPNGQCVATTNEVRVSAHAIVSLPEKLRDAQVAFQQSGGLHAAALATLDGDLIAVREDVGRHNALDKLIGNQFITRQLPLSNHILLMSSRASFELVQKASVAGIPILATIGAPTTQAIDLATELNLTLIGFVRGDRFNIYSHPHRVSDVEVGTPS